MLDCVAASCRSCVVNTVCSTVVSCVVIAVVIRVGTVGGGGLIHLTEMKLAEVISHVKPLLTEKTLTYVVEFDLPFV